LIQLPTEPQKEVVDYPQRFLIFSQAKAGKTTAVSQLPNSLIIDLEDGTKHIEGIYVINVQKTIRENPGLSGMDAMRQIYMSLTTQTHNFKNVVIDTIDYLQDYAAEEIKETEGVDYTELEWGKGYSLLRDKILNLIDSFYKLGLNVILIAHRKRTIIGEQSKEVVIKDVDLVGKLKNMLFGYVDGIAYLYRDKDEAGNTVTTLNFYSDNTESLEGGCRVKRLANRQVPLLKMDQNLNVVENNWKEIYPHLN
jgi:hypothetical protein